MLVVKEKATKPVTYEPARERIYNYVREQILRGILRGGSFVEEEHISSAMNVSRTPVREAFHRLEAERFIELLPRRGALVRQVTAEELVQLYETRRMLEGTAVQKICQYRLPLNDTVLQSLEAMEAMEVNFDNIDFYGHVELDRNFHRAIVASAGNTVTTELYDSLGSRQLRVAMAASTAYPTRIRTIVAQHRDIYQGLVAYDYEAVQKALEEHLHPVIDVVSRLGTTYLSR
jgi:DNA-binding GntR family transcriptional regulator